MTLDGPWAPTASRRGTGPARSSRCPPVGCRVSDPGLIVGRALCLAPVTLLDPRDWRWPDDGDEEWPLCWICLALTHVPS